MGTLTNLNGITEPQIPAAIARDSELFDAIAAHLNAVLMDRGRNLQAFDANNWNPNAATDRHKSAINAITLTSFNPSTYAAIPLNNIPAETISGILMQIELPASWRVQLFFNSINIYGLFTKFFWRSGLNEGGGWMNWLELTSNNVNNIFSEIQTFTAGIQIGAGGTPIKKLLSKVFTIDPPAVLGQSVTGISLSFPGAAIGDFCQIAPIGADLWNTAIWPFEFPVTVSSANAISLLLRNDWSGTIDLAPFQIRVVVMGF
jgi:hypothetical protein